MSSRTRGRIGGRRFCPRSNERRLGETNRPVEEYGDECGNKEEGCIRIMTNNINGLSVKSQLKLSKLKSFIDDFDIDIIGCQEINVYWNNCKFKDRLHQKLRGWRESCTCSVAYNTTEKGSDIAQRGGTALITVGSMVCRKIETGFDKTKLGRWQWTRFRGAHNRVVRIINVYRPCYGDNDGSVYQQHTRLFFKKKDPREPRAAWFADLAEEIQAWKETGDSIIIMGELY